MGFFVFMSGSIWQLMQREAPLERGIQGGIIEA